MDPLNADHARFARPTGPPAATPFVGQSVAPPGRITAPLGESALRQHLAAIPATTAYMAPPPAPTYTAPAGAVLTPVAPRGARRGGVSRVLLASMLILGLVAGGIGGGASAVLLSQGTTHPSAPASAPPPVVLNPSGVANGNTNLIHDIYTHAANSVVQVQVEIGAGGRFAAGGEGTGIVIDKGHVLTNNHVIDGATAIHILLQDGTSVDGKVVGTAPQDDLAVVSANLPSDKVQPATLGDSDKAQVGDEVVAIGNPFGLDHTVTAGIISAVDRTWSEGGNQPIRHMLQTDAPINPGNSGGPLFNLQGEVIGITTAIESPVRGSVGVGFAIPINRAKGLIPQLLQGSTVKRVWLGISGMPLDAQLAAQLKVAVTKGVLVVQVITGSPAEKAGLQGADPQTSTGPVGDIVTAIDGHPVASVDDITSYLDSKKVGDTVTVTVSRAGKSQDIKVTLQAWPDQVPQSQNAPPQSPSQPNVPSLPGQPQLPQRGARIWSGIQGVALDANLASQLNIAIQQGVLVVNVLPNGPAAKAGIQGADPQNSNGPVGDVITAVDGTAVGSPQQLSRTLNQHKAGDTVTFSVWRAGKTLDVKVTVEALPSTLPQAPGLPGAPNTTP